MTGPLPQALMRALSPDITLTADAAAYLIGELPQSAPVSAARVGALLLVAGPELSQPAGSWAWSLWLPEPDDATAADLEAATRAWQRSESRAPRRRGHVCRADRRVLRTVARRYGAMPIDVLAGIARDAFAAATPNVN